MAVRRRKADLRVVDASEAPDPHMSVSEAADSGSRLAELIAMRRVIARRIDDDATQARDLAALSKRQMDISREIDELRQGEEGDELDEAADSPDEKFNPEAI